MKNNKILRRISKIIILSTPMLFSIIPLLDLVNRNFPQIKLKSTFQPVFHIVLAVTLVEVLFFVILRQPQKVVILSSLIVFIFYSGSLFNNAPEIIPFLGIILSRFYYYAIFLIIIVIVTTRILWWKPKILSNIASYLSTVSIVWILLAIIPIGINIYNLNNNPFNQISPEFPDISMNPQKDINYHPDIYYIVLDAYGGDETINTIYGFDNSNFVRELAKRGFYIPKRSTSNYNRTKLSIASSLNFDYLTQLEKIEDRNGDQFLQKVIDQNRVFSFLKERGYTSFSISSGFESIKIGSAGNHFDENMEGSEYLEMLLFSNSILDSFHRITGDRVDIINPRKILYQNHGNNIENALNKIIEVAQYPGSKSKIVFAHILIPHPPFIFGTSNSTEDFSRPFCLCDGKTYQGSKDEYLSGYVNQIDYTNNQVIKLIDKIKNESINDPIIIIQGDHGPRSHVDLESVNNSCLPEAFSIFTTYYFPDNNYSSLYQSISPVNTFRIVLNQYFGLSLEILPNKNYFALNYNVLDVTDTMSSKNCNN